MTQNQIKNLNISIFSVFIIGYALLLNFSLSGLVGAAIAVCCILFIALTYNKQQSIVEKIDLYILLSVLGILATQYNQLSNTFTTQLFKSSFNRNMALQISSLIAGLIIRSIFNNISKKRASVVAKIISKYMGLFFYICGLSIFFLVRIDHSVLTQYMLIFSLFGSIAFCRSSRTNDVKAIERLSNIAFLLAAISLVMFIFFPMFRLSEYNMTAFLNITVLPWYSVLGITLLLAAFLGIGFHYGNSRIDEDSIFLVGIIGLTWVVKASVYFYFSFHWIGICIYSLLFLGFTNRFIKREKSGIRTFVHGFINNNEFYWIPYAAVGVVFSIVLINTGYIYFLLSLIIGLLIVLFAKQNFVGWVKDAVFWISLLLSIAGAACTFSLQSGFSMEKIKIIAALFIFTSIVMWMLNHKNYIGHNKFKATKIAMVVVFALLVLIPSLKAGANVDISFVKEGVKVGALIKEASNLKVSATAKGKDNSVKKLSYVWSDDFWYDVDEVTKTFRDEVVLRIENNHLIIWAEDSNGVITRKDFWFYNLTRSDNYNFR
jgi:hypothetical protein